MSSMTVKVLCNFLFNNGYSSEEIDLVKSAYQYAEEVHKGVYRKSGEPYIIHPLEVSFILAMQKLDISTICAGLLHDCVEDGINITRDSIAENFGETIAFLVDGVSKFPKSDFVGKMDQREDANLKKFLVSAAADIRVILIKIADRLHNMRTLGYQDEYKQFEKSLETLEVYVPLANILGMYNIKTELEDLSFKYKNSKAYDDTSMLKGEYIKYLAPIVSEANQKICNCLKVNDFDFQVITNYKPLYNLYQELQKDDDIESIPDFVSLNIVLETVEDCYKAKELLKGIFEVEEEKDFIKKAKNDFYICLETVIKENNTFIELRFMTQAMHFKTIFGLPAYCFLCDSKNQAVDMIKSTSAALPFYSTLKSIIESSMDDAEFASKIKENILTNKINIRGDNGVVELCENAILLDYLLQIVDEDAVVIDVYVNGCPGDLKQHLYDEDTVSVKCLEKRMN